VATITVRDIPPEVRDELAARAVLAGHSLHEYLRLELIELVARPSAQDWLASVRHRKSSSMSRVQRDDIVAQRDADRR